MPIRYRLAFLFSFMPVACSELVEPAPRAGDADAVHSARDQTPFVMLHLGTLGTPGTGSAQGVNDFDHVVGWSENEAGQVRAFLWRDGVMEELPGLGGETSSAEGINNRGEVAGHAENAEGWLRAVIWRNGKPEDLGTLGGELSFATAINGRGEVVGVTEDESGQRRGFIWSDGQMRALEPPPEGEISWATGINDRGDVVGWVAGGVLGQDAALWRGGEVTRLSGFVLESMASAINNRRQIVGGSFQLVPGAPGGPGASFAVVAAMWESGKARQLIPSPEAGWRSQALAINDRAQVVGFMTSGFGTSRRGFLLERGSVLELGPAGGVPTTAHDVSEAGTIVGESGGPVLWTSDPRTVRGGHGPATVSGSRAPEGRGARASRAAPVWTEAVCEDHGGLRGRVLGVEVAAGC